MQRFAAFLILIFAAVFSAASAQQRPLITDDIDITPEGAFEVSAGVDFFQNARFPLSGLRGDQTRVGDVRGKVGFASNIEFQVEGVLQEFLGIDGQYKPSAIPLALNGNSTSDVGDFTVSTKIKLRSETEKLPALGLKVGFQIPSTNQARGIGTNQINIFGKFIVQKKFGVKAGKSPRANIYGNLGIGILTAPIERFTQNDVLLYGLAGIFRVTDNVNLAAEINGRANTRKGNAPLGTESQGQFRLGAQIRASNLRFDAAGIVGITRDSPRTGITFGVTYQSPRIFTPAQ